MWLRMASSGGPISLRRRRLLLLLLGAALGTILLLLLLHSGWSPAVRLIYPPTDKRSLVLELRKSCALALRGKELSGDVLKSLRWVCGRVGSSAVKAAVGGGCGKTVMFQSTGWLRHLMSQYAIVYSLSHLYGARGIVSQDAWDTIHEIFPHISMQSESSLQGAQWTDLTLKEVERILYCPTDIPAPHVRNQRFYRIVDHPETSGLDLFQIFEDQLRKEFTPSVQLTDASDAFLRQAAGSATPTDKTFVGVYVGMDWSGDLRQMNQRLHTAELDFIRRHMNDLRSRLRNETVFVVFSEDMSDHALARWQLGPDQYSRDVVLVPNDISRDAARRIALMAACNRSIVMGTEAFWGAFLAKGAVISPTWRRDDVPGHRDGIKLDFRQYQKVS